jgi:pSer/pThr/pTyr-binding forkhead associated (FHA) protein
MTVCGRCGRRNPEALRFCADCGTRLAPAPDSSPAPATPPRGLVSAQPLAATTPSQPPPRQRPVAPEFDFRPKTGPEPCARCGVINTAESRFCTSCGNPLHAPPASLQPPVIEVAPSAVQPEPVVICSRCQGSNPNHTTFCQYCGAKLREPSVPPPATYAPDRKSAPPANDVPARLVVIAQDGTPGAEHPILGNEIRIGRAEGSVSLSADPYVSPHHMTISRQNGRFFVRDLESVNGVYLRLRGPEPLRHGDLVLMGLEVLRFELVSDAEKRLGPATDRGARVFGSPAVPRYARLSQHTVEGVTRDVYYLTRDETVVGRESGDIVFTSDPFMSRRHASLSRDPAVGTFTLRDLGSSNGTYLAIRGEHEITQGDHLRIGQHLFRLEVGGARR